MIRINLLPYREAKRAARRKQFIFLSVMVLVLGGLVVLLGHIWLTTAISNQMGKNNFLKKEITLLDKDIEEIKRLKEQTQALLSRKQIIESLQGGRAEPVHLLEELVRQVPDGVYLKGLKQNGARVNILGYAQSNARVSTLMRNLDASPWIEYPELVEIRSATILNKKLNEFNLNFTLTRQQAIDAKKITAAAATATPTPAPKK